MNCSRLVHICIQKDSISCKEDTDLKYTTMQVITQTCNKYCNSVIFILVWCMCLQQFWKRTTSLHFGNLLALRHYRCLITIATLQIKSPLRLIISYNRAQKTIDASMKTGIPSIINLKLNFFIHYRSFWSQNEIKTWQKTMQ